MISVLLILQRDVGEKSQSFINRRGRLRHWTTECGGEVIERARGDRRPIVQRGKVLNGAVDHPVPQRAQLLGVDVEQVCGYIETVRDDRILR